MESLNVAQLVAERRDSILKLVGEVGRVKPMLLSRRRRARSSVRVRKTGEKNVEKRLVLDKGKPLRSKQRVHRRTIKAVKQHAIGVDMSLWKSVVKVSDNSKNPTGEEFPVITVPGEEGLIVIPNETERFFTAATVQKDCRYYCVKGRKRASIVAELVKKNDSITTWDDPLSETVHILFFQAKNKKQQSPDSWWRIASKGFLTVGKEEWQTTECIATRFPDAFPNSAFFSLPVPEALPAPYATASFVAVSRGVFSVSGYIFAKNTRRLIGVVSSVTFDKKKALCVTSRSQEGIKDELLVYFKENVMFEVKVL
eukprot:TRINITY_DN27217_c0_g1_i1.p1 TRINITY_DN27217_c0_g1~~TRINITY_DN27217_c0_g1_i1.p1  ORF type:complete len:327 (+),score=58.65 TRINITY_DN27217_c0_g1_i1:47-982(+)